MGSVPSNQLKYRKSWESEEWVCRWACEEMERERERERKRERESGGEGGTVHRLALTSLVLFH
jgi:hypothetical protein